MELAVECAGLILGLALAAVALRTAVDPTWLRGVRGPRLAPLVGAFSGSGADLTDAQIRRGAAFRLVFGIGFTAVMAVRLVA